MKLKGFKKEKKLTINLGDDDFFVVNYKRVSSYLHDSLVQKHGLKQSEIELIQKSINEEKDIDSDQYLVASLKYKKLVSDFISEVITGWENVNDEDGEEVPFSIDNMLSLEWIYQFLIYGAYVGEVLHPSKDILKN